MTSRERVIATLEHKPVDRLPRQLWELPAVGMFRRQDREKLDSLFEWDFCGPEVYFGNSPYVSGAPCVVGSYTDMYGNVWTVGQDGVVGEVKEPLFKDYDMLKEYKMPYEVLDDADFSKVNASCAATDKFVLAGACARPFELMQFMRGTENLFIDLALEEPKVYELRDMLHDFFLREMRMWAATDVDGVSFMDDWGTQKSLLISPETWRKVYKPLYKEYCEILHNAGKYVFFHSDGFIEEIYPDLIEIGVDAINSQLFCMDIERLGREYAGKITFWGEMDRQQILPFGSPDDVRRAVERVAAAVFRGGIPTGVIAQCEMGAVEPLENIIALFEHWDKLTGGKTE